MEFGFLYVYLRWLPRVRFSYRGATNLMIFPNGRMFLSPFCLQSIRFRAKFTRAPRQTGVFSGEQNNRGRQIPFDIRVRRISIQILFVHLQPYKKPKNHVRNC